MFKARYQESLNKIQANLVFDCALSQASHRGDPASISGQYMWSLWCKKWYWERFFSEHFVFSCQYHYNNSPVNTITTILSIPLQQFSCQYHYNNSPVNTITTILLSIPLQQFSCQYHYKNSPVNTITILLSIPLQQFSTLIFICMLPLPVDKRAKPGDLQTKDFTWSLMGHIFNSTFVYSSPIRYHSIAWLTHLKVWL